MGCPGPSVHPPHPDYEPNSPHPWRCAKCDTCSACTYPVKDHPSSRQPLNRRQLEQEKLNRPVLRLFLKLGQLPLIDDRLQALGKPAPNGFDIPLLFHGQFVETKRINLSADGVVALGHNRYGIGLLRRQVAVKYPRPPDDRDCAVTNQVMLKEAALLYTCQQVLKIPNLPRLHELYYNSDPKYNECVFSMYAVPDHLPVRYFKWSLHSHRVRIHILRSILQTLTELHRCGIAHKDPHDENVLITKDAHEVFVIDLGRAVLLSSDESSEFITAVRNDTAEWFDRFEQAYPPDALEPDLPPCVAEIRRLHSSQAATFNLHAARTVLDACPCPLHRQEEVTGAGTDSHVCNTCANTPLVDTQASGIILRSSAKPRNSQGTLHAAHLVSDAKDEFEESKSSRPSC